jgi:M6 family metalloprotease-like protein
MPYHVVRPAVLRLALGVACGLALLAAAPAQGAPADPTQLVQLRQGDGTTIDARAYGDEWSHGYETAAGYTIVRDGRSWEYADVENGQLEPSGLAVGEDRPTGLDKHLREEAQSAGGPQAPPSLETYSPQRPNSGSQRSLVILVEFADQPSLGTTPAQWRERFFGAADSVRDFYEQASYGALEIEAAAESHGTVDDGVVGWITLPHHPGDDDTLKRQLAGAAIAAADPYVDYAAYDSDHDGKLSPDELHVTVIPAGGEASSLCSTVPAVWGHHWQVWDAPLVDGVRVGGHYGDGGSYTMFGEMHCAAQAPTHMATLGIMVHELGHDLGLPDLYDIDKSSSYGGGVGAWSVMASGSWLSLPGQRSGSMPAGLDAFSRYYQGWTSPRTISGVAPATALAQTATSPDAVRMLDNPGGVDWAFQLHSGTGEYYLLENRQKVGYDRALPACGVLVWHIDETRTSSNSANADDSRRLVQLEDADGDGNTWSDSGDPYTSGAIFTNGRLYDGQLSGVRASAFSGCAPTMASDLQTGFAGAGPAASITAGPSGPTRNRNVSFSFTALGADRFECRFDDHDWSVCTSPATFSALADGAHTFRVRALDAGGASDGPAERSFTVDSTGPTTTITVGPDGPIRVRSASFALAAPEPGSTVWCALDYAWRLCGDPISFTDLADGFHDFSAYAIDQLGNVGPVASRQFSVDGTAPTTLIHSAVGSTSATFFFDAGEPASYVCQLDGDAWKPCTSPTSYEGLSRGSHTFRARATDTAGNLEAAAAERTFSVTAATDVAPDGDGDGVPDAGDDCPRVRGLSSLRGCPWSPPPVPPVADRDQDGVPDSADRCAATPGPPANGGCPTATSPPLTGAPTVTSVKVKLSSCRSKRGACRRTATVTAKVSAVSRLTARVELKRCIKGRCTWVRTTTAETTASVSTAAAAQISKPLKAGSYRVVVTASGVAGAGRPTTKTFTVRR